MTPVKLFLQSRYGRGFSDRSQIDARQQQGFKWLREAIMLRSPFYAPYANRPFSEWPLMNKMKMMENFSTINSAGLTKEQALDIALRAEQERDFTPMLGQVAVGLSTGTSGQRGLFASNRTERALWAAMMLGRFSPSLLRKQRVALFLRADNRLYQRLRNPLIDFVFYDLLVPFDELLLGLTKQRPTVLIAPAQILALLAKAQSDNTIAIAPKTVVSVAEVLSPEDAAAIEAAFGVQVDQIYQCTEGVLGMTCRSGHLHLNESFIHIERDIIDEASGAFCPIITDLVRETLPIIRYRLDDVLVPDEEPCACGCTSLRLKRIEGRCDDILYWRSRKGGRRLVPSDAIRQAIATAGTGIRDYRTVQYRDGALHLWLETDDFNCACQDITANLQYIAKRFDGILPKLTFHCGVKADHLNKRRRVVCSSADEPDNM